MTSAEPHIELLTANRLRTLQQSLALLLIEAVASGASLGFRDPLPRDDAERYWSGVAGDVAGGAVVAAAATDGDELLGVVLIHRARFPNGRHRGELAKLIVKRSARRRGIGGALLRHAESTARGMGLTLLFLDTQVESAAEHLYAKEGWTRAGVIPGFAYRPDGGGPDATAFWYRELA